VTVRLRYRPPHDWQAVLGFLAARAFPGMELVDGGAYNRAIPRPFTAARRYREAASGFRSLRRPDSRDCCLAQRQTHPATASNSGRSCRMSLSAQPPTHPTRPGNRSASGL
jgi:hypothetical protein